ncbi:hypothetical protein DXG01_004666 [Tephrocybe rancida]|nr:hypothetical protein DXG01_004666 [Tephrocybe rancida]
MACHDDGKGLSGLAKDGDDWYRYFVNRFVDRDMLMRFHWGLGIGHLVGHGTEIHTERQQGYLNPIAGLTSISLTGSFNPITNLVDASGNMSRQEGPGPLAAKLPRSVNNDSGQYPDLSSEQVSAEHKSDDDESNDDEISDDISNGGSEDLDEYAE